MARGGLSDHGNFEKHSNSDRPVAGELGIVEFRLTVGWLVGWLIGWFEWRKEGRDALIKTRTHHLEW